MLTIYLLRHGQTEWNAKNNLYCGRTDIALTPLGIQQAHNAREQLKKIEFDAVYSSPLQRAYTTALIAGGDQEVLTDARLIEADFGLWEGKTRAAFIEENESLWNNWETDPMLYKAGGTGESAKEVIDRVNLFFASLQDKYPNGRILVVAHNAVNRFYLAFKLGMPVKNYRKLVQDNSTITQFELDHNLELTLLKLNA